MLALAPRTGIRIVSINRRDFRGSTPFPKEEINALDSASNEQLAEWYRQRGREIATFIDTFVKANKCPEANGNTGVSGGGIGLVGWSLGATFVCSFFAHMDIYSPDKQAYFKRNLRAAIFQSTSRFVCSVCLLPLQLKRTDACIHPL